MSILYYLRSLVPVDGSLRTGALIGGVADPASAPVASVSLVAITIVLLCSREGAKHSGDQLQFRLATE